MISAIQREVYMCREPIRMQDGAIPVPDGPGLGVEVDEETVARYRVA